MDDDTTNTLVNKIAASISDVNLANNVDGGDGFNDFDGLNNVDDFEKDDNGQFKKYIDTNLYLEHSSSQSTPLLPLEVEYLSDEYKTQLRKVIQEEDKSTLIKKGLSDMIQEKVDENKERPNESHSKWEEKIKNEAEAKGKNPDSLGFF